LILGDLGRRSKATATADGIGRANAEFARMLFSPLAPLFQRNKILPSPHPFPFLSILFIMEDLPKGDFLFQSKAKRAVTPTLVVEGEGEAEQKKRKNELLGNQFLTKSVTLTSLTSAKRNGEGEASQQRNKVTSKHRVPHHLLSLCQFMSPGGYAFLIKPPACLGLYLSTNIIREGEILSDVIN